MTAKTLHVATSTVFFFWTAGVWTGAGAGAETPRSEGKIKLWKEVDISDFGSSFVSLGDFSGDGKVDFLLSRLNNKAVPAYLVALDHSGEKLWELGDKAKLNDFRWQGGEPSCRGIAAVYDVDRDGTAEVVAELWIDGKPALCLIDGATGTIKKQIPSPLDDTVRLPSSRPVPMVLFVHFEGREAPPTMVLKYEASGKVPCHAVALDGRLRQQWHLQTRPTAMGHVPTVADLDGDGREEIVLGETAVGAGRKILWQHHFVNHADCTDVAELDPSPGKEVLVSICGQGPAYCLSCSGKILWRKTRKEVPHGQAIWAGNFIDDLPGPEVIILRSGHVGDFLTLRGGDGSELARFRHATDFRGYPDFPLPVNWLSRNVQSLWVPVDRRLVDGRGQTVQDLGALDDHVVQRLRCGKSKSRLAPQALAVDLCGDDRDELILYQPYHGQAIFIFTQPDSDGRDKPYRPQPGAYHFRSYF